MLTLALHDASPPRRQLHNNKLSWLDEAMFEGVPPPTSSVTFVPGNSFSTPCAPGRERFWKGKRYCSMRAGCVTNGTQLLSCSIPADTPTLHVDLSNYAFTGVAEAAFADPGFAAVESLTLAGNAIEALPEGVFDGMTQLKSLYVR